MDQEIKPAMEDLKSPLVKLTGQKVSDCEIHGKKDLVANSPFFGGEVWMCKQCGIEREAELLQEEKERDEAKRQFKVQTLFRECQIGQRFVNITFADYKPPTDKAKGILEKCSEYADEFDSNLKGGGGLLLIGKPGTGKNHLAAAICNQVMNAGHSTVHTTVMKMIRRVKATWSKASEETEQKAILSFCQPDLLVIDEVGVQFGSATEQLLLTEIINERYERMRPTIMISNLPTKELSDILGERVIDRFRDGGEVLVFDWDSYRKRSNP